MASPHPAAVAAQELLVTVHRLIRELDKRPPITWDSLDAVYGGSNHPYVVPHNISHDVVTHVDTVERLRGTVDESHAPFVQHAIECVTRERVPVSCSSRPARSVISSFETLFGSMPCAGDCSHTWKSVFEGPTNVCSSSSPRPPPNPSLKPPTSSPKRSCVSPKQPSSPLFTPSPVSSGDCQSGTRHRARLRCAWHACPIPLPPSWQRVS
jgi:hypothetical protein